MNLNTLIKPNIFINNRNDLSNTKANQQSVSFAQIQQIPDKICRRINTNNIIPTPKWQKFLQKAPGKTLEIGKKALNGVGKATMGILKYSIVKPTKAIWDRRNLIAKALLSTTASAGMLGLHCVLDDGLEHDFGYYLSQTILGVLLLPVHLAALYCVSQAITGKDD